MFEPSSINSDFLAIYRSFLLNRLILLDYLSKVYWIFSGVIEQFDSCAGGIVDIGHDVSLSWCQIKWRHVFFMDNFPMGDTTPILL